LRSPEAGAAPRARRALSLLELGLLLAAALFALGFHLWLPSTQPTEEDWRAAAAFLEANGKPGDQVVLHPWWTDEARLYVPERFVLWSDVHNATRDATEAPRLWLLAQPRLPLAGTADFLQRFLPQREPDGETATFGPLELTPYRNGRHRPASFRATEAVASAQVYLEDPGTGVRRPCPWNGREHRCPGPPHLYVAAEWREIDFAPVRCLWMHPPGGPQRLVAEFRVEPGPASTLRLEGGVVGEEAVQTGGNLTPVAFGVESLPDRTPLFEQQLAPGTEGLHRTDREWQSPEATVLKLWSQSERPDRRQLCIELSALLPGSIGGNAVGGAR
jgi:hypothetical protein